MVRPWSVDSRAVIPGSRNLDLKVFRNE